MSANPWTPGPWTWTDGRGPVDISTYASEGYCNNPQLVGGPMNEDVIGCNEYWIIGPLMDEAQMRANARLIAAAPEMAEALELLEDAASCLIATFERIPENYPESRAIHTHEGHTEAYLLDQIKAARALLARIRGDAP